MNVGFATSSAEPNTRSADLVVTPWFWTLPTPFGRHGAVGGAGVASVGGVPHPHGAVVLPVSSNGPGRTARSGRASLTQDRRLVSATMLRRWLAEPR